MKLLLVTQLPPPKGGIAAWSEGYLRYVKAQGHPVEVVNTAAIGNRGQDVNASKSLATELKRAMGIWSAARNALRKGPYDLVHVNVVGTVTGMVRDTVTLSLLGRKLPKVVEFHSNLADQIGGSRLGQMLLRSIVKKADTVLVLNSFSAEYLQRITGAEPILVSNFIEDSLWQTVPKDISPEIHEVLFTGHIVPGKGIAEILETAKAFPEIRFSLLGKKPEEVQLPACTPNVTLAGEKSPQQVQEALDRADLFLFPSHTEGFSLSLTEAMARGLPVIATDVGANRDMLEDRGGILTQVNAPDQLISALEKLQDPKLRETMSRWNLEKVGSCYTAGAVFQKLMDIYRNTIEKRG